MRAGSGASLAVLTGALTLAAPAAVLATTAASVGGCEGTVPGRILTADPSDYLAVLQGLGPGDFLRLAPGAYTQGLPFSGHNGTAGNCIVVEGPAGVWPPTAIFTVGTDNTVRIRDSSYLVIRNLQIDGTGDTVSADGVKAQPGGPDAEDYAHHITLENLFVHDHDFSQQTVCISTKVKAWNWVIRRNVLQDCGTGLYLGNSDGEEEFVAGLVEHNLVLDSVGYNMQIKHQNGRDTALGIPASAVTVIRHNVFSKGSNSSTGGDSRPNLLVGHWPPSGSGSDDDYLIYANLFYGNPTGIEPLFQGEGNVIFYANLLVNPDGPGVFFQFNQGNPKRIRFFQNTVVASTTGVSVSSADTGFEQRLIGNAVFAATTISGGSTVAENVEQPEAAATSYLSSPASAPGAGLDLYPLANGLLRGAVSTTGLQGYEDWDRDFDDTQRGSSFRGAYAGEGLNQGWTLALERKPLIPRREEGISFFLAVLDEAEPPGGSERASGR